MGLGCGGFFAALSKFRGVGLGWLCGWGCGDGEGRGVVNVKIWGDGLVVWYFGAVAFCGLCVA